MMDPYAHPQHMKVVKHLSFVEQECGNHSMLGTSLNNCTMTSFETQQRCRISAGFPNLGEHM
jgi:hypothetical protein